MIICHLSDVIVVERRKQKSHQYHLAQLDGKIKLAHFWTFEWHNV